MSTIIKPYGMRVAVRPVTEGPIKGIVIPDSVKGEKPQMGQIVACGNDCAGLNVGDNVLFGKYSGDDVQIDGEDLKILAITCILAVIE